MNEDELRRALRDAAGESPPTAATWQAIVTEAERRGPVRAGRSLQRFRIVTAAAAVLVLAVAGVVVAAGRDGGSGGVRPIVVGVPSVTGGSSDLIVESGVLTDEGGFASVPADVAADVAGVEGVEQVVGVVRAFARFSGADATAPTPSVVVSWDGGDGFDLRTGRAPSTSTEVALTPLAARRLGVAVGDDVRTDTGETLRVVGTFALPGDGADVVLAAVDLGEARFLARRNGYTRLHVRVADGADPEEVRDAIVGTVPLGYRVVGVNQLGTTAQLRDELQIQQSYFDLMNADGAIRTAAVDGAVDDAVHRAQFERFRDQAAFATLRIQRFSFLDADHAEVVYAIYYGINRSPMVPAPQRGMAVRTGGRWKLARTTLCGLASLVQLECDTGTGTPAPPPDGWDDPDTQPEVVAAFRTMADPRASLEERTAAVRGGADLRDVIRTGLADDQRYAGAISFHISGVRRTAEGADILYALQADGDPPLATPYPIVGHAFRSGGRWQVDDVFACGLRGLVDQRCQTRGPDTTSTTEPADATTETTAPAVEPADGSTETTAPPVATTEPPVPPGG